MGFGSIFKKASKAVKKTVKKAGAAVSKAGHQATQNIVNLNALPAEIAGKALAKSIRGIAPAVGEATSLLRNNPELAGLAGSALGIPGLGGLGVAGDSTLPAASGVPSGGGSGIPMWIWLAAGAAVLFILLPRKN